MMSCLPVELALRSRLVVSACGLEDGDVLLGRYAQLTEVWKNRPVTPVNYRRRRTRAGRPVVIMGTPEQQFHNQ